MSAIANPDPEYTLVPSGNLQRRLLINRIFVAGCITAAVIAVLMLAFLIFTIVKHGISAVNWSFITSDLPLPGAATGGIGPALLGSAELALMAVIIAVPTGVLIALYLNEYGTGRVGRVLQMTIDLMNGIPTIVIGVFVFGFIVKGHANIFKHHIIPGGQSGLSAAVALAIIVTPLITRSSFESIRRVPGAYREASEALGIARWRMIVGVVLPTAAGGILTAAILAMARAAGETAPLLFTSTQFQQGVQLNPLQPMPNIPYEIFNLTETGGPPQQAQAWGAAFLLIIFILIANVGARVLLRRSERKRGL
jgi:phosphate transport system permease protein